MREILLLEFEKLKDEQIARIRYRDGLFYVTLAVCGGVFSIAAASPGTTFLLLFLPIVVFILGVSYISNDEKISTIGSYFRFELAERLARIEGVTTPEVFSWETAYRADPHRGGRKFLQLLASLLLFSVSGLTAIAFYFVSTRQAAVWSIILAICDLWFTLMITGQILRYSDLPGFSAKRNEA